LLNHVNQRQYQKHLKLSAQMGKPSFALAWFANKDKTKRGAA
jgi:translation elongation factor EF-1alpha